MFSNVFSYGAPSNHSQAGKGCDCWRPDKKNCRHLKSEPLEYAEADLDDIADSLMQVMRICRLPAWEVKRTEPAIRRSFKHYEEIRYRIDRVPRKRFNKENFLHDVAVEAGMERMHGQLAYGIVKRAFRAYYHGTGEGGKRLETLAKQMRHRSECLWVHAAKRTAEIFAVYAGLMSSEQKKYEECIECVYLSLFKELESRFKYEISEPQVCQCKPQSNRVNSVWDALSGTTMMSAGTNITTELFFNKHTFEVSNPTSAVSIKIINYIAASKDQLAYPSVEKMLPKAPVNKASNQSLKSASSKSIKSKKNDKKKPRRRKKRDIKCNCPSLQCIEDRPPPVITAECSQGPYVCRWIPYEETFPAHCVPCPPMEDICPPCDEVPCAADCTCTCDVCTCPPADEFVEEEHAEKLSGTGLEDRDTDFCWLAPFRDGIRVERSEESFEDEEEMGDEEALFECRCTCEYKRRAFPHLFTYLAPFKQQPTAVEEALPVEEPVKSRKPPCGISWETYRCWTEAMKAEEELSEPACRTCPHIAVLAAAQNTRQKELPTVKGISMDITVKSQHFPSEGNTSGKHQTRGKAGKASRSSDSVKKCSIKELDINLKEAKVQKDNLPIQKLPDQKRKSTQAAVAKPKAAPAGPASAPAQAAAPATAPANSQRESDEKLTKEDILNMLGLNK